MVDTPPLPDTPRGSSVQLVHTERTMNCYVLFDSDLDNLATLGVGQSVCLAVASAAGALWFDLFKDTKLADAIPAETQELIRVFEPLCAAVAVVSLLLSGVFWYRRRTKLQEIKSASRVIG